MFELHVVSLAISLEQEVKSEWLTNNDTDLLPLLAFIGRETNENTENYFIVHCINLILAR